MMASRLSIHARELKSEGHSFTPLAGHEANACSSSKVTDPAYLHYKGPFLFNVQTAS